MDPFWFGVAQDLLDCACTALAATDRGCPARACVVPGSAFVEDDCCAGQLQVVIERVYRTVSFPDQSPGFIPCDGALVALDVLIGLRRCAPGPSCEQASANAELLFAEGQALWNGIMCCLSAADDVWMGAVRDMRPSPGSPSGGCTGWDLRVTVGVNDCAPC